MHRRLATFPAKSVNHHRSSPVTAVLAYCLSPICGIIARFLFGIMFGAIASATPLTGKAYLHALWLSGEAVFAIVTILVFQSFGMPVTALLFLILLTSPGLIFFSPSIRKPENAFYFGLESEPTKTMVQRVNRLEALSRFLATTICFGLTYHV